MNQWGNFQGPEATRLQLDGPTVFASTMKASLFTQQALAESHIPINEIINVVLCDPRDCLLLAYYRSHAVDKWI